MNLSSELNRKIDQLYALPNQAKITMTRNELRELLLYSDGWFAVNGRIRDVKSKSLGAGIYQVWLELRS